jgi:ABC-type branched-subunit amino acid transport system substrate-binding protein
MLQAATRLFAHKTRSMFGALLLAPLVLVAAGCAPNLPPQQPQSQAPAPTVPVPTPQLPVDTSVKVGLLLPLSGPQAGLGRTLLQAAEMGLFEVGDERFTLLVEDTATAGGADSAARKLLAQGARIMLGPVFGADTRKVAPIAQGARVPVLAFTNDKTVAQPGVYALGVTPQAEVERVVAYAVSQGKRRFAILSPASPYGNIVSAAYREAIVNAGGTLAQMASYDPSSPDYTGTVEQLGLAHQRDPFDALMLPEGGTKLRQLAPLLPAFQIGVQNVQILGTGLWANDPALAQQTGLNGAWFATTPPDKWQPFVQRYQSVYGSAPEPRAGLVYDAITLVVALAQQAAPGTPVDFNSPILTNPNGFAGTTGVFRLNADGTVDRSLAVIEVQPGGGYVKDNAQGSFAAVIN